jgi:hypothetical protein
MITFIWSVHQSAHIDVEKIKVKDPEMKGV